MQPNKSIKRETINAEYFTIKVSGKQLEPKVFIDVAELAVDTSFFLPAMLSLTLNDNLDKQSGSFNYADTNICPLGGEITVDVKTDELEYSTGNISGKLFSGVIAAVEPQFLDEGRALLRIRAYDHSFKLTRVDLLRVHDPLRAVDGLAELGQVALVHRTVPPGRSCRRHRRA